MPDEAEQDALSKLKAYLDAGQSFDAIRSAGWAPWIEHLEAKGYDLRTGQLALRPPDASPTPRPTPRSTKLTRVVKDKRVVVALLAVVLVTVLVIIGAVAMGGREGEEATIESEPATADAVSAKPPATGFSIADAASSGATARSENVSSLEEAEARVQDAMAAVASIEVEIAYLLYGPDLCDVLRDAWPSLTTVSSRAEAAELFVEAIESDLSDSSLNERARMGELYVAECARQAP